MNAFQVFGHVAGQTLGNGEMNMANVRILKYLPPLVLLLATTRSARAADEARPVIGGLELHTKISPRLAGTVLLSELNCAACHAAGDAWMAAKGGPDLSEAGSRMHHDHLQRFIAKPSAVKPGTTMPDVLGHLPAAERGETARALAHYLASLGKEPLVFEKPAPDSMERGRKLYHSVGCVACHSPEEPAADSPPPGSLADKYSLSSLTRFLKDPLAVRRDGRMPDLRLDHDEAVDIASYLIHRQRAVMETLRPDASLAQRGKALFAQHNCHACHAVDSHHGKPAAVAFGKARLDKGCLADATGVWPRYPLSSEQRAAIKTALAASATPLTPTEQIEVTLARLNCLACHQRGDIGGVAASRNAFFTGADENLGEQGRLPPSLTGVGAKLKRDWLRDVVVSGASARPYLHTRMPRFGEANTVALVDLLKREDQLPAAKFERVREADKPRQIGRDLAGSKGFNCIACHTFREKSSAPMRALDLTTMAGRLEENWFHHYMSDPARFAALTIMPGFWPDGKSPLVEVLDGNPGKQRDALWRYLSEGPEASEPRGLVLEPLVIAVKDDAVMLRRNYPGIGKRGIGVGYPSGINLSFDAGQMRLASVWSGGFIEASGVWRGQGSGQARVLGRDTVTLPEGPAFAILESATTPWPTNTAKQAEGFQFKGYSLDDRQRPAFRYQFGALNIDDRFLDVKDASGQAHFERTILFPWAAPPRGFHLRLAVDQQIVAVGDREFAIGKTLRLRLPPGGVIRDVAGRRELLLPLAGKGGVSIEYHWGKTP
jgi:mono/diheme cytochrome c family protein